MLHLHNGDSTAATARDAKIPGEHLAWREALVCGPAPGGLSANRFRKMRAKHLSETYGIDIDRCEKELKEQQQMLERSSDHDELVLWFEHDLFCQIHLIYLLDRVAQRDGLGKKISLICVDRFPGMTDFRGLGQLNQEQLASLLPQRREVTSAETSLAAECWQAYSSPNPLLIEALLNRDTSSLPFFAPAMVKHLARFPSLRNGLGRVANVCLELISDGHTQFAALFQEFCRREPLYGFGDAQVLMELKRLAEAADPLIRFERMEEANFDQSLENSFYLTESGKAVLNGEEDFVELNGLDHWLGGVHLKGDEAPWRWNEATHCLISRAISD